jgi:hypothetical protein
VIGVFAAFAVPAAADDLPFQRDRGGVVWQGGAGSDAYDRGYREGLREGEGDGRSGRRFDYAREDAYRNADRGYDRNGGNRDAYREWFRRGFAEGYRAGYERTRIRSNGPFESRRNAPQGRRYPGYQEPASARGYSDGFAQGQDDRHDGDRYDPVGHKDYRKADEGYYREYGSKDAYQNNYRAGFRQGYEDGYRDGTRR